MSLSYQRANAQTCQKIDFLSCTGNSIVSPEKDTMQ